MGASVGSTVGSVTGSATAASVAVISVDSTEVVSVLAVSLLVVSLLPHAVSISAAQRIVATAFAASLCSVFHSWFSSLSLREFISRD